MTHQIYEILRDNHRRATDSTLTATMLAGRLESLGCRLPESTSLCDDGAVKLIWTGVMAWAYGDGVEVYCVGLDKGDVYSFDEAVTKLRELLEAECGSS